MGHRAEVAPARTLQDDDAEARFRDAGYVVLDWLDETTCDDLESIAAELLPEPNGDWPWTSDFYSDDPDTKRRVRAAISAAFAAPVAANFTDHESFLHAFVVNHPGPGGGVEAHQHSTVLDETRFRAAVIWCALSDTSPTTNGTLYVVPGSHHVQRGPKAERGPAWFDGRAAGLVADHGIEVVLRKGQALVFDNALVHGSEPNLGTAPRRTAVANVAPRAAQLLYHSWTEGGEIEVYGLDPEFFLQNVAVNGEWAEPEAMTLLTVVPASTWVPDDREVETLLARRRPGPTRGPRRLRARLRR